MTNLNLIALHFVLNGGGLRLATGMPRVLPQAVQDRIRSFGLDDAMMIAAHNASRPAPARWGEFAGLIGCPLVLPALLTIFLVGLWHVFSWLLGGGP